MVIAAQERGFFVSFAMQAGLHVHLSRAGLQALPKV
jgi:hypothetical protein